jgi:hypothetical protein
MAQWSPAREKEREQKKIQERVDLIDHIRKGGWTVQVFNESNTEVEAASTDAPLHYVIKMPGAFPAIIRDIGALRRIASGIK